MDIRRLAPRATRGVATPGRVRSRSAAECLPRDPKPKLSDEAVELQGSDNETIAAANVLGDLGLSCEKAARGDAETFQVDAGSAGSG